MYARQARFFTLVALFLLISGITMPTNAEPQTVISRETFSGNITLAKLANGLTILVKEDHNAPVATVRCYVRNTGSINEGVYLGAGLSHVLEHVVAGGSTTRRSEDEIERIVDTFGGVSNAYTSLDETAYYIDCPAKNVEMCVELIADSMQHAAFVPEEFDRELEVVQRELADGLENRGRVMWKLAQETIYLENPARVPIIGYLDVLKQMKREQIIDFYRRRYVPNNQVFAVAGDVNPDAIIAQVAELWANTPRGFEDTPVLAPEPDQIAPRSASCEMDGSTTDIMLAFPTVRLEHKDLYALDLLSIILSVGDSSRMVQDMRNERGLALSVSTSSYTPTYERGYFAVRMVVMPEREQEAMDAALEHLYRLQTERVTDRELAKAKKQKEADLVFSQQTIQAQLDSVVSGYTSTGDVHFEELYVRRLQEVTAEQILDVARRYFVPERLNTICIRPKSEPGAGAESAAESSAKRAKPTLITLENGLKVLVKRVPTLPLVSVQIYCLGGNLSDSPETAGRTGLLASMLDRGTETRSAEEIREFFDSIGGGLNFSGGRVSVSGNFMVLAADFESALDVFADCVKHPAFPHDKFLREQELTLGSIVRRASIPSAELFDLFAEALPDTTPYHVIMGGTVESISALTPDALRELYFGSVLDPENMLLTIYGDVDEARAEELARQHFGGIAKLPNHTPVQFARENAIPEPIVRHKVTQKESGMVLLAFPAPSTLENREDAMAMRVLRTIIAGCDFPGGWLHKELRGEGLVYSVHGVALTGVTPGYILFVAQTSPDKVQEVAHRLFRNVQRAIDGDISEKEFRTAIQQLHAIHAQSQTTVDSQASTEGLNELYGFGYDYSDTFDARCDAVTLEQVVDAARRYLGGNYVLVSTSNLEEGAMKKQE